MIKKFFDFINEKILSKHNLFDICQKLNINYKDLKYLSSGNFGDAYKINDKVLKITNDLREIKDIKNIINKKIDGVVKYYNIIKISENTYVILMEYVKPLATFIKDNNIDDEYVIDIINILIYNWRNINNKEDYINLIKNHYILKEKSSDYIIAYKMFDLYKKLKKFKKYPDLHLGNLGLNKNNEIVMFDFNKL